MKLPAIRLNQKKTIALAMGLAGLLVFAFFMFAYHSARFANAPPMMRAKCPVCALAGQSKTVFEPLKNAFQIKVVFAPFIEKSYFPPRKACHRRISVRAPPVLFIAA